MNILFILFPLFTFYEHDQSKWIFEWTVINYRLSGSELVFIFVLCGHGASFGLSTNQYTVYSMDSISYTLYDTFHINRDFLLQPSLWLWEFYALSFFCKPVTNLKITSKYISIYFASI